MMIRNPNKTSTNVRSTLNQIRLFSYNNRFNYNAISEYKIISDALSNAELITKATLSEKKKIEDYLQKIIYKDEIVLCNRTGDGVFIGGVINDTIIEEAAFRRYVEQAFRVERKSLNWTYEDLQTHNLLIDYNHRMVAITGDSVVLDGNVNYIQGISILGELEDGCDVSIKNDRLDDITIVNRSTNTSNAFALYTGENFILKPGGVINFKYEKKTNNFVGTGLLKAVISKNDIDDIIGDNNKYKLFIDSSNGDTIDASDMNTVLTAYVDEYFTDITESVTQWQWFRESGTDKESIASDEIWKLGKNNRVVYLNAVDFTLNIYERPITFICEATINNIKLKAKATIG